MQTYLVEAYVERNGRDAVAASSERLERAVAGTAVRYVRSIFVAAEETCFYVLEAPSAAAVADAAARAGVEHDRIMEAA